MTDTDFWCDQQTPCGITVAIYIRPSMMPAMFEMVGLVADLDTSLVYSVPWEDVGDAANRAEVMARFLECVDQAVASTIFDLIDIA